MQAERTVRHQRVQVGGEFVIVTRGDMEIRQRRAEQIMREVFVEDHGIAVDAVITVQQRDDQRREAAVAKADLADQVGAAVAVEAGIDHFQAVNIVVAAPRQPVDAAGDRGGIARAVLEGDRKPGNEQYSLDQRLLDLLLDLVAAQQFLRVGARVFRLLEERVFDRFPFVAVDVSANRMHERVGDVALVAMLDHPPDLLLELVEKTDLCRDSRLHGLQKIADAVDIGAVQR